MWRWGCFGGHPIGTGGSQAVHSLCGLAHFHFGARRPQQHAVALHSFSEAGVPWACIPQESASRLSLNRWLVSTASGPHPHPHPLLSPGLGCTGECGAALFLEVAPSVQGGKWILFVSAVARTAMPSQGKTAELGDVLVTHQPAGLLDEGAKNIPYALGAWEPAIWGPGLPVVWL